MFDSLLAGIQLSNITIAILSIAVIGIGFSIAIGGCYVVLSMTGHIVNNPEIKSVSPKGTARQKQAFYSLISYGVEDEKDPDKRHEKAILMVDEWQTLTPTERQAITRRLEKAESNF